jgi:hypothetical protein
LKTVSRADDGLVAARAQNLEGFRALARYAAHFRAAPSVTCGAIY